METKTCEICGQDKPQSEFSKSYRNRCRACVAEQTRNARHLNGHHAMTVILDDPKIDCEIAALIRKSEGRIMNYECEEIGERAVAIAHSAMKRMKFIKH